jgi:hypothetical protein
MRRGFYCYPAIDRVGFSVGFCHNKRFKLDSGCSSKVVSCFCPVPLKNDCGKA